GGRTGSARARRRDCPADHHRHPADRRLLGPQPHGPQSRWGALMALVEASGLHVTAQGDGGVPGDIVRDIGFSIERGEVLALIGESGSGKTTIALALLGY